MMQRNENGFGLIDLLVTVGLIMIVATMAIPENSKSVDAVKVNLARREISRLIDLARMSAITKNRSMMVVFNSSTGVYRVRRNNSGSWEDTELIGYLPNGVDFLATRAVVFDSRGLPNGAITLSLSSQHSTLQLLISEAGGITSYAQSTTGTAAETQ